MKANEAQEQYIKKSALVAEIENLKNTYKKCPTNNLYEDGLKEGRLIGYTDALHKINTLEVKEIGNNFWKPADGDDLPEIDMEVIALLNNGKVVYAHRPSPDGWDGKNILTGDVRHYDVQTYDKGGWNQPDVKFWLDCELPKMEE